MIQDNGKKKESRGGKVKTRSEIASEFLYYVLYSFLSLFSILTSGLCILTTQFFLVEQINLRGELL